MHNVYYIVDEANTHIHARHFQQALELVLLAIFVCCNIIIINTMTFEFYCESVIVFYLFRLFVTMYERRKKMLSL